MQFVPTFDSGAASSTGNAISPVAVTISELTNDFETYESRLVIVSDVNFTAPTGNFENGIIYPITDGTDSFDFRTTFFDVNYIGIPIPVEQGNIIGLPNSNLAGNFLTSRIMADLDFDTANDDQNNPVLFTALHNNYPNPFNPTTTISFSLKEREMVTLSIYNLKGQKIRTLESTELESGQHSIIWNGDDQNGNVVSSGIYFYKLDTDSYSATKKMVMMK
jgi:hypothetical protein